MKHFSKPNVLFCLTKEQGVKHLNSGEKVIMLTLEDHRHNDFGLKSVFDYVYFVEGEEVLSGWLKIGVLDSDESPNVFVRKKLKNKEVFQFKDNEFFSLQQEIQSYRDIVKKLGVKGAKEFLLALNDIVANQKHKAKSAWLSRAIETKAFKNSLSRTSQAYFAYMNGGAILDGVEYEEVGKISDSIYLKGNENIDGVTNLPDIPLEFNFQSILPARIVTLIGKNGAGKSQSLKALVKALINGNDNEIKAGDGGRPRLNRLLAIATPGEIHNTFPREKKKSMIDYRLISHRRSRHADHENGLSGLIVNLLRSNQEIGEYKRINIFRETIDSVLTFDKIGLLIFDDEFEDGSSSTDYHPVPLTIFDGINESGLLDLTGRVKKSSDPVFMEGEKHFPLSSGQISFLRLAAQLCLHIENGSLVLLDEPETHFHPHYITGLTSFLTRILELSGSIAVLATHSAYFVREVPRSQVLVMNRYPNGEVEVARPRIKTLGAEIGEISFSVFGEQDFGHLVERIKNRIEKTPNSIKWFSENDFSSLVEELPSEALMYIENELGVSFGEGRE